MPRSGPSSETSGGRLQEVTPKFPKANKSRTSTKMVEPRNSKSQAKGKASIKAVVAYVLTPNLRKGLVRDAGSRIHPIQFHVYFDDGGDVDTTGNHPVFEFIKAPRIAAWDQSALVKWCRDRQQYERKIKERCTITGEIYENVVMGVMSSVDTRILNDLARYSFEKDAADVTDKDIQDAVQKKCSSLLNAHAPDIEETFKRLLAIDLKERDIEARVMKYFMDFDLIVEENGLAEVLGSDTLPDKVEGAARLKSRCKLLIDNLAPPVLKTEIKRLVSIQHRKARTNDVELHKLIVQRATEQQHFHLMQQEFQAGPKRI